jgi:hypothetical protein
MKQFKPIFSDHTLSYSCLFCLPKLVNEWASDATWPVNAQTSLHKNLRHVILYIVRDDDVVQVRRRGVITS